MSVATDINTNLSRMMIAAGYLGDDMHAISSSTMPVVTLRYSIFTSFCTQRLNNSLISMLQLCLTSNWTHLTISARCTSPLSDLSTAVASDTVVVAVGAVVTVATARGFHSMNRHPCMRLIRVQNTVDIFFSFPPFAPLPPLPPPDIEYSDASNPIPIPIPIPESISFSPPTDALCMGMALITVFTLYTSTKMESMSCMILLR